MSFQKIKCKLRKHDWFTETDAENKPVYRMCQCCGKYEQPIISAFQYTWAVIHPHTITAEVLRQQNKIYELLKQTP